MTSHPSEHSDPDAGSLDERRNWQDLPSREQEWPTSALYMIATPIGNLRDMTLRALDCLVRLDALGAEDTRMTRRLLDAYQLRCKVFALHQHNEQEAAADVIARLARGERIGYVSDAGTPGISDPGARLVAAVRRAGFRVLPIPGASALTSAVSVAGLPDAPLYFQGFLPSKAQAARRALAACPKEHATLIFYEAPHRIEATLGLLAEGFAASRTVTVARELSKQFETVVTAPLEEILVALQQSGPAKGEFVVLLHAVEGLAEAAGDEEIHDKTLSILLERLSVSDAVALAVQLTGAARNTLYKRALVLKQDASAD
jgi:16S rRNA (cytidine1402-2'-O)-methyltransferase